MASQVATANNDDNTTPNNETTKIEEKNNDNNDNNTMPDDDVNKINESDLILSFDDILLDRAYGCCVGAAIGDSIGSFCEFKKYKIPQDTLNKAMTMPGGGTWGNKVNPGQITDDTELAMSLAYGLIDCIGLSSQMNRLKKKNKNKKTKQLKNKIKNILHHKNNDNDNDNETKQNDDKKSHQFDLMKIAKEYKRWKESRPFDIGFCTKATLYYAPKIPEMKQFAFEYNIKKLKQYKSGGNMANGSLMRCMPLCLYGHRLNNDNLYKLMAEDSSITHHNQYVFFVATCYALMVQYLLTADKSNDKRNIEAYNVMIDWLKKQTVPKKLETEEEQKEENERCNIAKDILDDWLKNVEGDELKKLISATWRQGFVKIAFQRTCYHLLKGHSFQESIRSVVGEGGDSDTNACIVGGVMGAYWGLTNIPTLFKTRIHLCDPLFLIRHKFQAKWYFDDKLCELLIKHAPTDDEFNCVQYERAVDDDEEE